MRIATREIKPGIEISKIWGSHGGEYEDGCLLGDRPDDGGSKDLWNVGKLLPDYTVLQPRRQPSSSSGIEILLKQKQCKIFH
jgi:hypothetical protein